MTNDPASSVAPVSNPSAPGAGDSPSPKAPPRPRFTFTDDGCRTEIRVGALLLSAGVFTWLWAGPPISGKLCALGMLLIAIGTPIQAMQARRGRPGYPWKLGLAMLGMGLAMWPDLVYRYVPGGSLGIQECAVFLVASGAWMCLWWMPARRPVAVVSTSVKETP